MFELLSLKGYFALAIIAVTLVGGLPPVMATLKAPGARNLFYFAEALSRGIFLGTGFMHLLADAMHHMHYVGTHNEFPVVLAICALTITFLVFIEKTTLSYSSHLHKGKTIAFIIISILSIHALIEGAALGIDKTLLGTLFLFIAIIAHKASEAFALGVKIRGATLTRAYSIFLMCVFALMTPVGILFGSSLAVWLSDHNAHLTEAIFDAIAAGTFIYIATSHEEELDVMVVETPGKRTLYHLFYMLGVIAIGIMSLILTHNH